MTANHIENGNMIIIKKIKKIGLRYNNIKTIIFVHNNITTDIDNIDDMDNA